MILHIDPSSVKILLAVLAITSHQACYLADHSAAEIDPEAATLDRVPFETVDPSAMDDDAVCPPRTALKELVVGVRTSNAGGRFQPKNVGAIWIEDADGRFVKTLKRWGKLRAKWLMRFNGVSMADVTDAVTSATLTMHQVHDVSWDLTDRSGCEVEDGPYELLLELTDRSGVGKFTSIPFTKQQDGLVLMPNETQTFHDMSVVLQ